MNTCSGFEGSVVLPKLESGDRLSHLDPFSGPETKGQVTLIVMDRVF